jgi:hypothetical protein
VTERRPTSLVLLSDDERRLLVDRLLADAPMLNPWEWQLMRAALDAQDVVDQLGAAVTNIVDASELDGGLSVADSTVPAAVGTPPPTGVGGCVQCSTWSAVHPQSDARLERVRTHTVRKESET